MEKFSTEMMGYNKKEVNNFVSQVLERLDQDVHQMKRMEKELVILRQDLIKYKQAESTLSRALTKTESLAEETRALARKEAEMILSDARINANRIINDALLEANKVELKKDTLERNMRIYKKKLKQIVEQQLDIVEEIEVLEL